MFAQRMKMACRVAHTQKMLMTKVRPAQAIMMVSNQRLFSSYNIVEKAAQKLNKAIESEVKYENENYT
jgi:uncharacterized protein with NRDE domain